MIFVGIPGGINGDTYISIKDTVLLGRAFSSKRDELVYSPNVDINCDGYVSIKDTAIQGIKNSEKAGVSPQAV